MTNRHAPQRIVLVGMPGSGKTVVARMIAKRLGSPWQGYDTDDLIVAIDGRPIPTIFSDSGEEGFRRVERQAIAQYEGAEQVVLATGGGAVLDQANRRRLWQRGFVVYLKARPETLAGRVKGPGAAPGTGRPLLQGEDTVARLRELLAQRAELYELADWVIQTDGLFPDQVADEIVHAHQRYAEQVVARPGRERAWEGDEVETGEADGPAAVVTAHSGSYEIYIGSGELERLGTRLQRAGLGGRALVVADGTVAGLYGEAALGSLRGGGFDAALVTIPSGEEHKHLATVSSVYEALFDRRAERGDAVVALGGGVTTDLAGYVAATYLRGVPLVHVPTSLLGMVDAAIGGKVGVDHDRGKNLIGAFYQPRLVVADVDVLTTLPRRDFIEGWAEVIKHALIMDPALLNTLERDVDRLLAPDAGTVTPVLRRSAQLKAKVVSADEREGGLRMTLNYGHTIGHAIEAATGYSAVRHGEAVAVGMQGAAAIAVRMGLLDRDVAERQRRVLQRYGLPLRLPGVDAEAVLAAMAFDKKVAARKQRWVLLTEVGKAIIRNDVPAELVREVVAELLTA